MADTGWMGRLRSGWLRLRKGVRDFFHEPYPDVPPEGWNAVYWESGTAWSLRPLRPPLTPDEVRMSLPFPSPLPDWMVNDLAQVIRTTPSILLLEHLMDYPLEADADRRPWQKAWRERAFDRRCREARRIAWDVLLREPVSEKLLTGLIVAALEHESDWYVLQSLADWCPVSPRQRERLRRAWEQNLSSRLPSRKLQAKRALTRMGVLSPAESAGDPPSTLPPAD